MKSSKQVAAKADNSGGVSARVQTLHQRLHSALGLGTRFHDGKGWKWKSTDIEIQRHVLRSISSFLDSVTPDISRHSVVKDSVADIIGAMVWILQYKSQAAVSVAANVVLKLMNAIPKSIMWPYLLDLVRPLLSLLCGYSLEVLTSCAIALNMILSRMTVKEDPMVWEMLNDSNSVHSLVNSLSVVPGSGDVASMECFLEMVSLLSTILHRWPRSRYCVWSNVKFMEVLGIMIQRPEFSVKIVVMKLYAGVALCGNGAKKLLQNEEALGVMVSCMDKTCPISLRLEGFRLARCLATNEEGYLTMASLFCGPIVKAIVDGMIGWSLNSRKMDDDQLSLLVEACQLACIVRWGGEHHNYFWKHDICYVLLRLLSENLSDASSQGFLLLEEQIPVAKEALKADFLITIRPYIWDILGWLAAQCTNGINHELSSHEGHINILITCACLSFVDSIQKGGIIVNDVTETSEGGSATRAVLMMIYSPCKYFESKAKQTLSEILKHGGKDYMKQILRYLSIISSRKVFGSPDVHAAGVNLMAATCYSGLPLYQSPMIKSGGVTVLMAFIGWCMKHEVHVKGLGLVHHGLISKRLCCWEDKEDWEGDEMLLLCGLWGLAELLFSEFVLNADVSYGNMGLTEAEFVGTLKDICMSSSSPGLKWYSAHMLSYFGLYGFPCKLGQCIGRALHENEDADMQVILRSGQSSRVHCVILSIRCPSLLPPRKSSLQKQEVESGKEIHLSSHVGNEELTKLLEYVYLGYTRPEEEHVKKLKILAKHCGLQPLSMVLSRSRPNWGSPFPSYDLSVALTSAGQMFSDIILESKENVSSSWECTFCSVSRPHVHAHKVVLGSRCDYLRALFQSGMQESHSNTVKVPVSWDALNKLVHWFYTEELPNPLTGCPWLNMGTEEKLQAVQPYLELCWISDFWFLETVGDICYIVVVSHMEDSDVSLSLKLLQLAANLSLWKLAEVAADRLALAYRQLCQSGDLELLDEGLAEMIRAASVRISQSL
ncbi:unnamed protein product [Linum trigynum]|uniref:BTB domain-containing protein n=1 Tax=Linum trigynum TaxID=586398 RepID=A0AAV2GGS3_9ROSI